MAMLISEHDLTPSQLSNQIDAISDPCSDTLLELARIGCLSRRLAATHSELCVHLHMPNY
jgi:hypothetical protein